MNKITLNMNNGDCQGIKIEVDPNMSLRALHYTIQDFFGFGDQSCHHFSLPVNRFEELIENDFLKWKRLVGVFFNLEQYPGVGAMYKKNLLIEKQHNYHFLDINDTYYSAQSKLQSAKKAENIMFESLTVGDVFFSPDAKKIIDRDKILEYLLFVENDAEGAFKVLSNALETNDKETISFILKASRIYNTPITDTLYYHFNNSDITITQ